MTSFKFCLIGQLPSGKNQVGISTSGGKIRRYPNARFVKWRTFSWEQIRGKRLADGLSWHTLELPASVVVDYWPGDLIGRDVPGMMDALCHLLEWCPVHRRGCPCQLPIVRNDKLLVNWSWQNMGLDRENPRVNIEIKVI